MKAPMRICLFGGGTDVNPFAKKYGGLVINFAINKYRTVKIENLFEVKIDGYKGSGGLGGSAAIGVAAIGAMYEYLGFPYTKGQVADRAFQREIDLGWHGGCQDQHASAFGGLNLLQIKNGVEIIPLPKVYIEKFLPWLYLFDLDIKRHSYDIQEGFKEPDAEQSGLRQHGGFRLCSNIDGFCRPCDGFCCEETWPKTLPMPPRGQ